MSSSTYAQYCTLSCKFEGPSARECAVDEAYMAPASLKTYNHSSSRPAVALSAGQSFSAACKVLGARQRTFSGHHQHLLHYLSRPRCRSAQSRRRTGTTVLLIKLPVTGGLLSLRIIRQVSAFGTGVEVMALDAAMPFDFEHKASVTLGREKRLTVGIVGFGTFGQFLARRLVEAGHQVSSMMRLAIL